MKANSKGKVKNMNRTTITGICCLGLLVILLSPVTFATQHDLLATSDATVNVQEFFPNYQASITIPADGNDANLASLAKISPDQAKDAGASNLSAALSSVQSVSLGNENGNLIYSVQVVKQGTAYDVKVDAGNAKVLSVEQGVDNEAGAIGEVEG